MKHFIFLVFTIFLSMIQLLAGAQEVLQWRGADRSGVYNETGLLKSWPAEGPALLWESGDIGNGYGSPVITRTNIFVNGEIDSISYLFALDRSGKFLWKSKIGREWTQSYPGTRTTPTVMDDLAYVTAGWGQLACLETRTGKERWSVNMTTDFHGQAPRFGFSESVLVDGNTVYCSPRQPRYQHRGTRSFYRKDPLDLQRGRGDYLLLFPHDSQAATAQYSGDLLESNHAWDRHQRWQTPLVVQAGRPGG
jgi:outer membrane protein assembly factor BamB